MLADYRRPNDKIASLLAGGDLVQLRRGLYLPGAELRGGRWPGMDCHGLRPRSDDSLARAAGMPLL